MPIHRRSFLLAGSSLLTACASDITQLRQRPVSVLATELGVCAASYSVLRAGAPQPPTLVSGCTDAKLRDDAIFQAASLTKPVVAFAALRLVLDGRLDIEAPVSQYLPDGYKHFHGVLKRSPGDAYDLVPRDVLDRVSVAQLLSHSSGFPNWSGGTLSFESPPGSRWSYSGEGFVLLQSVIEAVTGTELSIYLDQHVFAPLRMGDTSLVWRESLAERVVAGTGGFGMQRQIRFRSAVAAASLYTTSADYAKFMSALLANDALISLCVRSPVEVDRSLGLQWGLGWGIEKGPGGPYIWQWGNNPGFRSFAMASLTSKDGFVILTNSERGMPLAASLANAVLPADHKAFRFPAAG